MKTAGKLAFPIPDMMPMAGRFGNIKDLARSSLFGAGVTGLLTTLNTGNPLAGLTVAGADILGSTALAAGIGKLGKKKIFGKTVNFDGGPAVNIRAGTVPKEVMDEMRAQKVGPNFMNFMAQNTSFAPSFPQQVGQFAGSYGALMTIEPLFYPKDQGDIVQQQLFQRYGTSQLMTNPQAAISNLTYLSRDIKGDEVRDKQNMNLAPGTLYQYTNLAGNPMGGM
tara:strand:- start:5716 stop:6384 length:669 start_codon:yes stop_codon:yes gene_type:complete